MSVSKTIGFFVLVILSFVSCSVISKPIRNESISPVPFKKLLLEIDEYIGATVIIGGYILKTKNSLEESSIMILQSPLGFRQEPKTKDKTQGRFVVVHEGFLEPEVYSKDRKITVAGVVVGSSLEKIDGFLHPYLKIRSRQLYLWPNESYSHDRHYYDPWGCLNVDCWHWYRRHPYFW